MPYEFPPGSTSKSIYFKLVDSSFALPQTGLTSASAGAKASYIRSGGTATPITLVDLAAPDSAWSSGGFKEVGNASLSPGVYRLDPPNAALASGVGEVHFTLDFTNVLSEGMLVLLRSAQSNVGAGSITWVVTVNNTATSLPLAGAAVWVSTDLAGTNVVAGALYTNANGQVTMLLDAGPCYLWVQHEGFSGTNPTAITVA